MSKTKKIEVLSREVTLYKHQESDFISLTDIARHRDAKRGDYIIQNWMRTRNTIEFLGIWEQLNNPDFNSIEFDGIRKISVEFKLYLIKEFQDPGRLRNRNRDRHKKAQEAQRKRANQSPVHLVPFRGDLSGTKQVNDNSIRNIKW